MTFHIPQGGFLAAKKKNGQIKDLGDVLNQQGFMSMSFPEENVILAVKEERMGQGLWSCEKGCVVYDLDLTNQVELETQVTRTGAGEGALLLALYDRFGLGMLDMLRGAFSFALWDATKKRLLVATDFFGIKPVVYGDSNGDYMAASRIRTLLLDREVTRNINPNAVYHYLFFQAICSPLTVYSKIRRLEPGVCHLLHGHELSENRYYDITYTKIRDTNENRWQEKVFKAVEKAVGVFVPLSDHDKTGCFLSGGTDSSSIAGMYGKLSGKPAQTFSIGFHDEKYNELEYAQMAVDRFKTRQDAYFVTPSDTLELIPQLSRIYDEPFGNASVVPAFFCAQMAKKTGIDTLLGGDGGDEIFGGNERYVTNLVFERYHKIPGPLRRYALEPVLKLLPDKGIFHKASRYVRRANFKNPYRFYSYNLLAEEDNSKILSDRFQKAVNQDAFMNLAQAHYDRAAGADETNRLLYMDMKLTITDNDLRKVSQMAEAADVQVRYPYLDRDLVDFTAGIPSGLKVKYGKNRYIFKKAMEGFLPDEIINKPKHGMGLPISNWFRSEKILKEFLLDNLFYGSPLIGEYIRKSFMDHIYDAFKKDDTTPFYGDMLWVYLILELWLKETRAN